jgi:hypothetical protein
MSGGSMGYLFEKVRDADFALKTAERKALRAHMLKLADALKAVEWNDSGDGARDEPELIRACLSRTAVLEALEAEAGGTMRKFHELCAEIQQERARLGLNPAQYAREWYDRYTTPGAGL